ncbi:MAG: O-antigen ligase family protein, partial [Gemmatimonadaceae bacterium]
GAILALGVTVAFYIVIQGKGRGRTIMALGAAALVVTIFAPSTVWNRLSSLKSAAESGKVEDAKDDNSAEQRLAIMKVAADVAKAYPVMGVGWGAYPNANGEFARRSKYSELAKGDRDAHNTYLTVAAETGFVGLSIWLGTIFMCVSVALRGMREVRPYVPEYALQIKFVLLTLLAYGLSGVFGSFAHMNSTYLHLMTVFSLGYMARQEAATRAAAAGGGGMTMASGRRGRR